MQNILLFAQHEAIKSTLWPSSRRFFLAEGHKVDFIVPFGTNESILWPSARKKNCLRHGKNINFTLRNFFRKTIDYRNQIKLYTRKINFFPSLQNILLFAPHEAIKSTLCPFSRRFFLVEGHKVDFIVPCGTNKSIFSPSTRKKFAKREKH